ncbi:MAG TPA: universal stress protein [Desulfobacterales bacterium]|nr:universal stress protein [Desulfobacterales bacterium]
MATQKLLLPYNFTRLDQKALDFVTSTFGKLENIAVTVFNAYTPIPEIETDQTSVTGKLKENLRYLLRKIKENEALLNEVKDKLIEGGFSESRVDCIFRPRKKDIASEIIDQATSEKFDFIVLNRKHARVTRFFSGSISHKVVMTLKDVTVCIVS